VVERRSGGYLDPELVAAFCVQGRALLGDLEDPDAYQEVLDAEPDPARLVDDTDVEAVAGTFGDLVDLKSPALTAAQAAGELRGQVRAGRLDGDAVSRGARYGGAFGGRAAGPAVRTDRALGRRTQSADPGPVQPRDRTSVGDLAPHRRAPRPGHLPAPRPAPPRPCSRWSTAWSLGENSQLGGRRPGRSVLLGPTSRQVAGLDRNRGRTP